MGRGKAGVWEEKQRVVSILRWKPLLQTEVGGQGGVLLQWCRLVLGQPRSGEPLALGAQRNWSLDGWAWAGSELSVPQLWSVEAGWP